jgi:hypothetical protein
MDRRLKDSEPGVSPLRIIMQPRALEKNAGVADNPGKFPDTG